MAKVGHPKAKIDQEVFEGLCEIQCTREEIMHVLRVTDKPLNKWCRETYGKTFKEVFPMFQDYGKVSLRRAQYKMAMEKPNMAIWLGKQWLGQTDQQRIELSGSLEKTELEMEAFFHAKRRDL